MRSEPRRSLVRARVCVCVCREGSSRNKIYTRWRRPPSCRAAAEENSGGAADTADDLTISLHQANEGNTPNIMKGSLAFSLARPLAQGLASDECDQNKAGRRGLGLQPQHFHTDQHSNETHIARLDVYHFGVLASSKNLLLPHAYYHVIMDYVKISLAFRARHQFSQFYMKPFKFHQSEKVSGFYWRFLFHDNETNGALDCVFCACAAELERQDMMKTCLGATMSVAPKHTQHGCHCWSLRSRKHSSESMRNDVTSTESDSFFSRFNPVSFETFLKVQIGQLM